MPEVNSLSKASVAQANWHTATTEIPGPRHTTAAMPHDISIASYHWSHYLEINNMMALPMGSRIC